MMPDHGRLLVAGPHWGSSWGSSSGKALGAAHTTFLLNTRTYDSLVLVPGAAHTPCCSASSVMCDQWCVMPDHVRMLVAGPH